MFSLSAFALNTASRLSRPYLAYGSARVALPPSPKGGLTFCRVPRGPAPFKLRAPTIDPLARNFRNRRKPRPLRVSDIMPASYAIFNPDECAIDSDEPFTRPLRYMSTPDLVASCIAAIRSRRKAACSRVRREPFERGEQHDHTMHGIYSVESCVMCASQEYNERMYAARPYPAIKASKALADALGVRATGRMTTPIYLRRRMPTSGGAAGTHIRALKTAILSACSRALCALDGVTPRERRARLLLAADRAAKMVGLKPPRASRHIEMRPMKGMRSEAAMDLYKDGYRTPRK